MRFQGTGRTSTLEWASKPGSFIIAAVYLVAAVLSILACRGCARHLGHSLPDWRRLAGIAAIFTVVISWSGLAANGLFAAIWSAIVSLGLLRHYAAVDALAGYWMKSTLFVLFPSTILAFTLRDAPSLHGRREPRSMQHHPMR